MIVDQCIATTYSTKAIKGRKTVSTRGIANPGRALGWSNWSNHCLLTEPISSIPPAEPKQRFSTMMKIVSMAA